MGENKASEDLAYVRNALERQRRLACEILPMWFVGFVAFYFISTGFLKDLATLGYVGAGVRGNMKDVAEGLLICVVLFLLFTARKKRMGEGASRKKLTSAEFWFLAGPAFVFVGAMFYVVLLAKGLGFSSEVMKPFILAQLAFSFMFMGARAMRPVFWFGFGFALGGILLFLYPDLTPYPNTIFASVATGFFLFGAWRQQKLQAA